MFVVLALHRTGAAAADLLLRRTAAEDRFLAVQAHRDVQRIGLRAEGHGAPALEPGRARTHVDLDADLRDLPGPVRDLAGLRIHVQDGLILEIGRVDERAGRPIELPENAELAHLEERLASADIDQDVLEDFVHVLRFAGQVLVVPLHLSGVGIERERRVRVERRAVGAADGSGPRLGLRRAPVDEVRVRIVAAGNPRVAAGAEPERQVAPRLAAGLARASDGRRAPQFFPVAASCPVMKQTSSL